MKNKMTDLRNHLFETIEMLKDGEMEIDKAKAICAVSDQIIHSARVEVQAMDVAGIKPSQFLVSDPPKLVGAGNKES